VIRWIPLAVAASLALVACGGAAETKVVKPPGPLSWEGRTPKRPRPPVLIAPPPAYGNKIVMARGESSVVTN